MDTSQSVMLDEEHVSVTGEGDELMEEVEDQEGYSAYLNTYFGEILFVTNTRTCCYP